VFNPLDLYGPEFLLFYIAIAIVLNFVFYLWVRFSEPTGVPDARMHALLRDPYMLAYLRGGAVETIKLAIFGMTERGLLKPTNALVKSDAKAITTNNNVIEKQVAAQCLTSQHVHDLAKMSSLRMVADHYAEPLKECGLVASQSEYNRRLPMLLLIGGLLVLLSGAKISIAISRGRHNIMFLVVLSVFAMFICWRIFMTQRTRRGTHALQMQQSLFHRLLNRVKQLSNNGATNEAILAAAAFGFSKLPSARFPLAHLLRRDPRQNTSSGDSSSCSSSCGGGGCGGGCGGCGS